MAPQNQLKENMRIMALIAEGDNALHKRSMALAEKNAALAERDTAILQRNAAIVERNSAIIECDNALAALQFARENGDANGNCGPEGASAFYDSKHVQLQQQHLQHLRSSQQQPPNAFLVSTASDGTVKSDKAKRARKDNKARDPSKKPSESPRKSRKGGASRMRHHEWKVQDLSLNQITFDDLSMPAPVCSCTGKYHQCYKWGDGGWQLCSCTTTLSMHPLPAMPNRSHARVGGRKMSGSVFRKLLSRLAAEGYDLSVPVDLKDHRAKHGTNKYITIK